MKTSKWLIISASLLFVAICNAQTTPKEFSKTKIFVQFEDQNDAKKYECNNINYIHTKVKNENCSSNYDMSISCNGLADNKQLEWITNPKNDKTIKITMIKGGKTEREYVLKNVNIKTFSESGYKTYGTELDNAAYDLIIDAESITLNGIQMK